MSDKSKEKPDPLTPLVRGCGGCMATFLYRAETVQIIIRLWGAISTLYYDEMLLLGVASPKMAPRATSMYKNSNRILWPSLSTDRFPFE